MTQYDQTEYPRARLPERVEIEAATDMDELLEWRDAAEWGLNKIESDLEFLIDSDDDWRARALAALTAHKICLKHTERRIDKLRYDASKSSRPDDMAARIIDRTSWLSKFHQAAVQHLDVPTMERLSKSASKMLETAIVKEVKGT